MIEQDTVKLLRECDAGIKMGLSSFREVMDKIHSPDFRRFLEDSQAKHEKLQAEIGQLLARFRDEGKDPSPVAEGMSWLKTKTMLAMKDSDKTVADLMTDGCNMGVKSLNQYLNQYEAASEAAKDITKRLIRLEEELAQDLRRWL